MPVWDPKANDLLCQALDYAAAEKRGLFLDQACGADTELRVRVEKMLAAQAEAGSFLESPAADLVATTDHRPLAERPGTVIGLYKLLQQIGEGGMGVVFMAEQAEPIQRTVALKIIKPGMDTRQVIARFEAERQAVAMMDHPNIAKVLDAGTTDSGRPYFVMELVKGVPITNYCDEKHLPLRARLELFIQVCQAVQHAHQKGIIHRDIKPNNVLVAEYDNQPIPKVIDFGVAKATSQRLTDRTMFTEFGQVLGTMEYMSPEQAKLNQLDIDTRSDIYSLGVLLYELLAGSTPFEGKRLHEAAFDEMLRIIREEEPPKPSTRLTTCDRLPSIAANRHSEPARLSRDVRGELDWIVMKALEKDRQQRYATASALVNDVERHLHDQPVEALPPSNLYRCRKLIRRNKMAVAAVGAVAASLLMGLGLSTWMFLQEKAARQRAVAAEKKAETESTKSQQVALNLGHIQWQLGDVLSTEGRREEAERILTEALQVFDQAAAEFPEVANFRQEQAFSHRKIGQLLESAGRIKETEGHYRIAIRVYAALAKDFPKNCLYIREEAFTTFILADLLERAGRGEEAMNSYRRAAEQYRQGVRTLEDAIGTSADTFQIRTELSDCYCGLSGVLDRNNKIEESTEAIRKAIAILDRAMLDYPKNREQLLQLQAHNYRHLSFRLSEMRDYPAARESLSASTGVFRELAKSSDTLHEKPTSLQGEADNFQRIGGQWDAEGRSTEAREAYRQALAVQELIEEHESSQYITRSGWIANHYVQLGELLEKVGTPEDALRIAPKLRPPALELNPQELRGLAACHFQLASLFRRAGQEPAAEGELRKAVEVSDRAIELNPQDWENWRARGQLYVELGDWDKAAKDFSTAIKLQPDHSETWSARALAYFHRQQWDQAIADFSKAIELAPQVHTNWLHRAHSYAALAQWDNAAADFTKVIEGWPHDPGGWFFRGRAYAQLNQPELAITDLRQAIAEGFKDIEWMKTDSKLDPLRSNDEFKKLLTELEGETK